MKSRKYMPKSAIQKMVRKTWLLYIQAENSNHEVDRNIYLRQREVAVRAVEAGNPAWKNEFILP